jgi:uncharacterized membrane protein
MTQTILSTSQLLCRKETLMGVKPGEKLEESTVIDRLARWGYLGETHARGWVKSIIWRIIGIFILGGIVWVVTHDWAETTWITIIFHAIRTVLYYFHERVWNRISWGRIRANHGIGAKNGKAKSA